MDLKRKRKEVRTSEKKMVRKDSIETGESMMVFKANAPAERHTLITSPTVIH